ncbi:hypothetical protein ACFU8X_26550 [Brevibacillus porteri]|uniref:hypothetical protein n=1 Tax=Brevibacillus porteri TaxID=2126350 RepID=UPI00370CC56F
MGVAYKLHCERCSYKQNVYMGVGFRYGNLSEIGEWFEDQAGKERIREFLMDDRTTYNCFHGLYVCEKCKYLLNAHYLHLQSDTDSYVQSYDCPRCSEKMPSIPIDKELDHGYAPTCPECGEEKLSVEGFLDWD